MTGHTWDQLLRGEGCPFDAPRPDSTDHWDKVCTLSASSLYLSTNQTYRGQCLLILDARHATRPDEVPAHEWSAFCEDLRRAEQAIVQVVRPDHVNIAALGNLVPHLHWHIIPRYRTDPRWGAPIWLTRLDDMPDTRLTTEARCQLINDLRLAVQVMNDGGELR
jgi:diadenosine tetraphosphate (Ap4A) HIT family hydrolase